MNLSMMFKILIGLLFAVLSATRVKAEIAESNFQFIAFENVYPTDEYDYMAGYEGYIQTDDGRWGFVKLAIDNSFPNNIGADTYSFLIKYATEFEPNDFYLDQPQYLIHMVAPGQYRTIGYVEGMLLHGDSIALMSDDDAARFQWLLDRNLEHHFRDESEVKKEIEMIFQRDSDVQKLSEAESVERAQHHVAELARRYPFEVRREYNGARLEPNIRDNTDEKNRIEEDVRPENPGERPPVSNSTNEHDPHESDLSPQQNAPNTAQVRTPTKTNQGENRVVSMPVGQESNAEVVVLSQYRSKSPGSEVLVKSKELGTPITKYWWGGIFLFGMVALIFLRKKERN